MLLALDVFIIHRLKQHLQQQIRQPGQLTGDTFYSAYRLRTKTARFLALPVSS